MFEMDFTNQGDSCISKLYTLILSEQLSVIVILFMCTIKTLFSYLRLLIQISLFPSSQRMKYSISYFYKLQNVKELLTFVEFDIRVYPSEKYERSGGQYHNLWFNGVKFTLAVTFYQYDVIKIHQFSNVQISKVFHTNVINFSFSYQQPVIIQSRY